MLKFSRFIVKYRYWFMGVFLALFVGGLFCMGLVKVNYDFTEYLPPDSETRISLDLMEDTFGDIGTVQIMAKNVTEQEAAQIYALISGTENVRGVNFDAADPDYYQGGNALYQVFFNTGNASQETVDTVAVLRESLGAYELAVNGAALDTMYIQEAIAGEMPMILGIAFAIVLVILLLTSNSWFEPVIFLPTVLVAIVLNMGTNFLLGTISFISHTICAILQLALAMDYSIILLHRYSEECERCEDRREAMAAALSSSIVAVSSSSLTTIAGLLSLVFMQFTIGFDIGVVLAKGIVMSMLSVFFLMPSLILLFSRAVEKTRHKNLLPRLNKLSGFSFRARHVVPVLMAAVFIVAAVLQTNTIYTYSVEATKDKSDPVYAENQEIVEAFGEQNNLVILYTPDTSLLAEENIRIGNALIDSIEGITVDGNSVVKSATGVSVIDVKPMLASYGSEAELRSLLKTLGLDYDAEHVYLDEFYFNLMDALQGLESFGMTDNALYRQLNAVRAMLEKNDQFGLLYREGVMRVLFSIDLPTASEEAFVFVERLRETMREDFSDLDCYVLGDSVSTYDIRETFKGDLRNITLVSVLSILIIVLLAFRSIAVPVLLVAVIQGSIWINMAISAVAGEGIFFVGYLILICIQMGATIDYGIVLTNRYMERRITAGRRDSLIFAMNAAFPTIITSGGIFIVAGFLIGGISSVPIISTIGMLLGRGAVISVALVLFLLPELLVLFDRAVEKTTLKCHFYREERSAVPTLAAGISEQEEKHEDQ